MVYTLATSLESWRGIIHPFLIHNLDHPISPPQDRPVVDVGVGSSIVVELH